MRFGRHKGKFGFIGNVNVAKEAKFCILRDKMRTMHGSKQILDLASGEGEFSVWLANQGHNVVGLDIQENIQKLARNLIIKNNAHPPDFICADITKPIPFTRNCFDIILLFDVLDHIEPESYFHLFHECERILRPGGFIFIAATSKYWKFPYTFSKNPLILSDEALFFKGEYGHKVRYIDLANTMKNLPTSLSIVSYRYYIHKLAGLFYDLQLGSKQKLQLAIQGIENKIAKGTNHYSITKLFLFPFIWLSVRLDLKIWTRVGNSIFIAVKK